MSEQKPITPPTTTGAVFPNGISVEDIRSALAAGDLERAAQLVALRKELAAIEKEREALGEAEKSRIAKLKIVLQMIETREAMQDGCSHIKDNGQESAVVAQRDSSNNLRYICQHCQRIWLNDELPAYLHVHPRSIGGPTFQ